MSFIKYQKHLPVSTYKGGFLHNASCCGETCDDLPTSPLDKTDPHLPRSSSESTTIWLFRFSSFTATWPCFSLKGASRFKLINSETTNSHEFNNFKLCKKNDLKLKVFVFFREFELWKSTKKHQKIDVSGGSKRRKYGEDFLQGSDPVVKMTGWVRYGEGWSLTLQKNASWKKKRFIKTRESSYGGFLKWWVSPTTMGVPTKNDHFWCFGRFGGTTI